jgi:hypothetical protein
MKGELVYNLRTITCFSAFCLAAGLAAGAEWHVTPTGTAEGKGSANSPWDIKTAFAHPAAVQPGDTIWLHGGTYKIGGTLATKLNGTAEKPIIVRQFAGERATLDTGDSNANRLQFGGSYAWYWGFEVMSSAEDRETPRFEAKRGGGLNVSSSEQGVPDSPGLKFINLIVHDTQGGYGFWAHAVDGEIYGNLIYYNGCNAFQHGVYTQNREGVKRLVDNIMLAQSGWGIHAYGSEKAYVDNFHIEGNMCAENGTIFKGHTRNIQVGGGRLANKPIVANNYCYYAPNVPGGISCDVGYTSWGGGSKDALVKDNYFAAEAGAAFTLFKAVDAKVTGNTFVGKVEGCSKQDFPENEFLTARPAGVKVFVRSNKYEPGRAHVCIFNWDRKDQVEVDIAAAGLKPGDKFEIRDAWNYYGAPVVTSVFDGKPAAIPMKDLKIATPIGKVPEAPKHTAPEFGAFVIMALPQDAR